MGLLLHCGLPYQAYLLATVIGLFVGLARVSKNVFVYNAATLYVEVVRGIPMIVLILYFAYALIPIFVDGVHGWAIWDWLSRLGVAFLPEWRI